MNWKKHILIFIAVFMVGSLLLRPGACTPGGTGVGRPLDARIVELVLDSARSERLSASSFIIQAELADTAEKRAQGLSDRGGLEPGYGMLYVYKTPQKPEFSGTANALDVSWAFVDEGGTITSIERAKARDGRIVVPDQPVKYVLEVRDGWFEDRNVRPGTRLTLPAELAPTHTGEIVKPAPDRPAIPEPTETEGP